MAARESAQPPSLQPARSGEEEIALIFPADYLGPTIAGKWKFRKDGQIHARFTRRELAFVLWFHREVVLPVLASERSEGVVSSGEGGSNCD